MEKIDKLKNNMFCYILIVIVFILISILSYDNLNKVNNKLKIEVGNKEFTIETEVIKKDKDIYINMLEYNKFLNDNIYLDKVSRKVIYTTEYGIKKADIDNNNNIIYKDSNIWINIKEIEKIFNKKTYNIAQINTLVIENSDSVKGEILNNNIDFYYSKGKNGLYNIKLKKGTIVKVLNNAENIESDKYISVIYNDGEKEYIGYILKNNLEYILNENAITDKDEKTDKILVGISENNVYSNMQNVDIIAIDVLKLKNPNGNIIKQNRELTIKKAKKDNKEVYAIIDNDFNTSNFDNSITSSMLKSHINREKNINEILKYIEEQEMSGVIVNFKRLKIADKTIFTQYIRELVSAMHAKNFNVIVKSGLESYIDTDNIIDIADSVIFELYNSRTINSNSSGPHFEYAKINNTIEKYKQSNVCDKIILEIPLYSILWTERSGIIVQAENYSSKLSKEYISKNNISVVTIDTLKQRYFEVVKGRITYKMWIEDEYSVKKKIDFVNSNGLRGISLYKLGYETNEIKEVVTNEF